MSGDHVHECPDCHERPECSEPCDIEPDLGVTKAGLPFGFYSVCDDCGSTSRDCEKCHATMTIRDGDEPTALCDHCAHEEVERLRAVLAAAEARAEAAEREVQRLVALDALTVLDLRDKIRMVGAAEARAEAAERRADVAVGEQAAQRLLKEDTEEQAAIWQSLAKREAAKAAEAEGARATAEADAGCLREAATAVLGMGTIHAASLEGRALAAALALPAGRHAAEIITAAETWVDAPEGDDHAATESVGRLLTAVRAYRTMGGQP
jgi:hypothetical protein